MAITRIDTVAIRGFISDPSGPVYQEIRRRANRVQAGARRMVGVKTGRLRGSIRVDMRSGLSPEAWIGSDVNYSLLHHQGARRHVITPQSRRRLRFVVGGRVVYATQVNHPGSRPNPYLTVPLMRDGAG